MSVDSDGPDVRERMIVSAGALFGERGYAATGLRDVVAHSSTPRGSIYHHLPGGKAELARAVLERAAADVSAAFAPGDGDPIAALRAFLDGWRDALERSDYRTGSPILAIALEPDDQTGARDAAAAAFERWADAFAATLQADGVKRKKAARLALLSVAAIEGAVVMSRARGDTEPLDAVGRELEAAIESARKR
ncbi:MAG TPA: TetR/AcrR family transcriptional regulator [Solirubrobacteraceae bacterium]|jgi:AcrR family transcriptional regulator